MIRPLATAPLATLAALLLSGCGSDEKKAGPARGAEGEILGQSVSDAMLPLDTVRSQPPLAPRSAEPGEAKPGGRPASTAAEAPAEAEAAPPAPPAKSAL